MGRRSDAGNERILVVVDEGSERVMIANVLSAGDFLVEQAADTGEARLRIGSNRPDLIVLDAVMSGGGVRVLRRYKGKHGVWIYPCSYGDRSR